jgi:ADP-ribose pyrophosphatase YjhB (NUDIX family)
MKPIKNSISYVIYNQESQFLVVLRPESDKELPNVWGLPAGMVQQGEAFEDAVSRSLKEKLGVEGKIIKLIGEGSTEREDYVLFMKLYQVEITKGAPKVPQPVSGITQYKELRWGVPSDLDEASSKGSLCSRLYLNSLK